MPFTNIGKGALQTGIVDAANQAVDDALADAAAAEAFDWEDWALAQSERIRAASMMPTYQPLAYASWFKPSAHGDPKDVSENPHKPGTPEHREWEHENVLTPQKYGWGEKHSEATRVADARLARLKESMADVDTSVDDLLEEMAHVNDPPAEQSWAEDFIGDWNNWAVYTQQAFVTVTPSQSTGLAHTPHLARTTGSVASSLPTFKASRGTITFSNGVGGFATNQVTILAEKFNGPVNAARATAAIVDQLASSLETVKKRKAAKPQRPWVDRGHSFKNPKRGRRA